MAGAWARMARLTLSSIPQRLDPILSEVRTSYLWPDIDRP